MAFLYLGEEDVIKMLNCDCMDYMRGLPDKAFDLAIVDPPYGDGGGGNGTKTARADSTADGSAGTTSESQSCLRRTVQPVQRTGGTWSVKYQTTGGLPRDIRHWDYAPDESYFNELFRVANKIIIWGGNYFNLPPSRNFIVWKKLSISEAFSMAMAEYAWTNIEGNSKIFECVPQGTKTDERFHPTQKPIALYKWLLSRYAKPGQKILDTHGGSGSICIACHDLGYDLTWMELDKDYYDQACERYKNHVAQGSLFEPKELIQKPIETDLFEDNT